MFIFVVLLAAALGLLLINWDSGRTAESRIFTESSEFVVWAALIAGLLAAAAAVAVLTWSAVRHVAQEAHRAAWASSAVGYLLICAAVITGPLLVEAGPDSFQLYDFKWRIVILSVLVLICAAGCFGGLMMLRANLQTRRRYSDGRYGSNGEVMRDLLEARTYMQRFLTGAAALITAVVLMIGGLQSALTADANYIGEFGIGPSNVVSLPDTGLLLLGAFFAALLAIVFIPTYTAWQAEAVALRDRLYPIPGSGRPSAEWFEGRSNLEGLLETRASVVARLTAAFGILAPFVGSIASALLGPAGHGG